MKKTDQKEKNQFFTLTSFCQKLGVNEQGLLKYIYGKKIYFSFPIKKRNGSSRIIRAPKPPLKAVQLKLKSELENFYTPKSSTHGFVPERSVKTNAATHVGKKYVLNIDLKDFFETIHFGRVKNLFMKSPFLAPENVATVMAHICCYDGRLAQGAPTSPLISNMICRKLDSQLQALASKKKCHYSRYADDITFSFTCSKKYLPSEILSVSEDGFVFVGKELEQLILANGFSINTEKTRLQASNQRQMVTGLVVNESVNLRRSFIRKTSSMLHILKKFGAEAAESRYLELLGKNKAPLAARQKKRTKANPGDFFVKVLKGRINYIQMIKGRNDPIYRNLAYRLSVALGKENKEFLKSPEEILGNSVFIVNNILDDSQGTAFLLKDVGIVTNQHVVDGIDCKTARHCITFTRSGSKEELAADLLFSDKKLDIAIFHADPSFAAIPTLEISRSQSIRPMDPVLSIGFPSHVEGSECYITTGKTTQLRRNISFNLWCIDTVLMEGNSGGPVFDSSMKVIGVAARGSSGNASASYIYGFIPITEIMPILARKEYNFRKDLLSQTEKKLIFSNEKISSLCIKLIKK